MRLTVPEPKIELYDDGFAKHDQLNRKPTGDKLSDLVERIDDPLVIALDGSWGSGKSFFLKCWVGEHLQREGNTTQTVYFDAFKHDFLDDPLIALTDAIATRFEKDEKLTPAGSKTKTGKIKKVAWLLGKSSLKIGASLATFGATNHLEELGDAVATAVGDETKALLDSNIGDAESNNFWAAQRAKIASMDAFKQALVELTEPATESDVKKALEDGQKLKKGEPTQKLVIVIDELDRCRPDYALSLLEIIKHFFNVDGVHFVLGVNLTELQNSVKARYGSGVDARKYLRKFVTLAIELPRSDSVRGRNDLVAKHFERIAKFLELEDQAVVGSVHVIIENYLRPNVSLRDAENIASLLAVTLSSDQHWDNGAYKIALSCLVVARVMNPELFVRVLEHDASFDELRVFFRLPASVTAQSDLRQRTIWNVLAVSCGHVSAGKELESDTPKGDALMGSEVSQYLSQIGRKHLGGLHLHGDFT